MNNTSIKMFAAGVLVGVGLTGAAFGMAGEAHADTITDETFIATLAKQGISNTSGNAAEISAAHTICQLRIGGMAEMDVVGWVKQNSPLTDYNSGYLVGASEMAYCPAYYNGGSGPETQSGSGKAVV